MSDSTPIQQEILDWWNSEVQEYQREKEMNLTVWNDFYEAIAWNNEEVLLASGPVEVVEDFGGEGQGDRRFVVFSIDTEEGRHYYKVEGYYASWDGTTWEDLTPYRVFPREKTITEYVEA